MLDILTLKINDEWNTCQPEKLLLTNDELKFDISDKSKVLGRIFTIYTENIFNTLICWYCKKHRYLLSQINIEHIKDLLENYSGKWMDGFWIRELEHSFVY